MTTTSDEVTETTEVELVDKHEIIQRLGRTGLAPSVIAEATGVSPSFVKNVIRRRTTTTLPDDPEIAQAWKSIELEAIDHVRRVLRVGSQQDRMALLKIIAGRALSRRTSETSESFEEMRMAWEEIRDEQRRLPESTLHAADWNGEDDDEDDD